MIQTLLAPGAPLVWSSALGRDAPFPVPTQGLVQALAAVAGHPWRAVQSEAHWGTWAVLRPG
jgi:hypothetical protein